MKNWLFGKTLSELEDIVVELGAKKFVAKQLTDWLYKKEVTNINDMTNLSITLRDKLSENYEVGIIQYSNLQVSNDGTKKYLYKTLSNGYIESAYIPEEVRATLCISSQAGCKMGCLFCMTAKQGFQHNLTVGEILNQLRQTEDREKVQNVVYMGMGEPLDNVENVLRSIEILTSEWGYGWSPSRITLSSIGIMDGLKRYLNEAKSHLTISLHSPFTDEREQLMPAERKNAIIDIVDEIRKHDFAHQRRVSFGYILFKGVNDTEEDIECISKLLKGIPCRINLIPYHKIEGTSLEPLPHRDMVRFRDALSKKGFIVTIRASRGEDIDAACGLLSTKYQE